MLFNIIHPAGWRVGLIRVEDVAIGCLVSLVVGLVFWPRGAATAPAPRSAPHIAAARTILQPGDRRESDRSRGSCDRGEGRLHSADFGRLDDAFRQFLAERGAKHVPSWLRPVRS